jgi:hypothetical protein
MIWIEAVIDKLVEILSSIGGSGAVTGKEPGAQARKGAAMADRAAIATVDGFHRFKPSTPFQLCVPRPFWS